jgi:hypothetical protein
MQVVGPAACTASNDLDQLAPRWLRASVLVTGATTDEARTFASAVGADRCAFGSKQ